MKKLSVNTLKNLMKNNLYRKLRETTSSDAIDYAPGSLLIAQSSAIIPFPGVDNSFEPVIRKRKRKKKLKEAMDKKVIELKKSIVGEVESVIRSSRLTCDYFISQFRYQKDQTPRSSLIGLLRKSYDLEKLESMLEDDLGELEMILSSLESKSSLSKFEVFQNFTNLFGVQVITKVSGIDLVYNGVCGFDYNEREEISTNDFDFLSSIEENGYKLIKVAGPKILPVQKYFDKRFYTILKEELDDRADVK